MYDPNANWTAATAALAKAARYYVAFDGYTAAHFASGPVVSAATTKKLYLANLRGGGQQIIPLEGKATVGQISFDLTDHLGEVTDLLATEAPGAALATMINRKVTIYAGYATLAEADYAPIFVVCGLAYVTAWTIIQLLAPRLEPARLATRQT